MIKTKSSFVEADKKITYFYVIPETCVLFSREALNSSMFATVRSCPLQQQLQTPRSNKIDAAEEIGTFTDLLVQFLYSFCPRIQNSWSGTVWLFFKGCRTRQTTCSSAAVA